MGGAGPSRVPGVVLAAVTAVVAVLLAGCGPLGPSAPRAAGGTDTPTPTATTGTTAPSPHPSAPAATVDATGPGLRVLPPSSHVTGTYPARCHVVDGRRPDPSCTPGAVRSDVTQDTLATTVCLRGWTATVRAPESETNRVKKAAMIAYGEPSSTASSTELDHFVPLELGGSNDVANLWPEPTDEPGHGVTNGKDVVENALKAAVCGHTVTLAAAQDAIAADWTTAESRLGVTR